MPTRPDPIVTERLRRHELFEHADAEQVDWLVRRGTVRRLADGELLFADGAPATMFVVLLDGELLISKQVDGRREVLTRHTARPAGDLAGKPAAAHGFTGEMPLLAGESYVADANAVGPTLVVTYDQDSFLEMFARIPWISRVLLPVLAWRIQSSEALAGQRNTLQALGTLAAGLAHELNNPAAAVARNAAALRQTLRRLAEAHRRWLLAGPAAGVGAAVVWELVAAAGRGTGPVDTDALEDELGHWLADRGVPRASRLAGELADDGIDPGWLDRLAAATGPAGPPGLADAVEYAASSLVARGLVAEIAEATDRIVSIIGSVRDYANLDRAPLQDVDVAAGIDATVAMLRSRMDGIRVVRSYHPDTPLVRGYPGELNQVWTNLIDNAVDAMHGAGELRLSVRPDGAAVLVDVIDDGAGVPAEVVDRIFEPFFTTKDVGKGTGLGLHLSYRIVTARHGGTLEVSSRRGETRFTVRLPRTMRPPAGGAGRQAS